MNQVTVSYTSFYHPPLLRVAEEEMSLEVVFVFQFDVTKLALPTRGDLSSPLASDRRLPSRVAGCFMHPALVVRSEVGGQEPEVTLSAFMDKFLLSYLPLECCQVFLVTSLVSLKVPQAGVLGVAELTSITGLPFCPY